MTENPAASMHYQPDGTVSIEIVQDKEVSMTETMTMFGKYLTGQHMIEKLQRYYHRGGSIDTAPSYIKWRDLVLEKSSHKTVSLNDQQIRQVIEHVFRGMPMKKEHLFQDFLEYQMRDHIVRDGIVPPKTGAISDRVLRYQYQSWYDKTHEYFSRVTGDPVLATPLANNICDLDDIEIKEAYERALARIVANVPVSE